MTKVIPLPRSQTNLATQTLFAAFHDDPMWTMILPDRRERERVLHVLWRGVIRYCQRYGAVTTTPNGDATAAWIRPNAGNPTFWKYLSAGFGLPRAVLMMRTPSRNRFLGVMSKVDKIQARIMPEPHWYLWALGVAPASQSQGLGRSLVREGLNRANRDGVPCYLETQNVANVSFYRSLGFEPIHECGFQGIPLRIWFMRTATEDTEGTHG